MITSVSTPRSMRSLSRLMPAWGEVKRISNSAVRKGAATLFFTTFARTRLPITSDWCLSVSIRRRSMRTEL